MIVPPPPALMAPSAAPSVECVCPIPTCATGPATHSPVNKLHAASPQCACSEHGTLSLSTGSQYGFPPMRSCAEVHCTHAPLGAQTGRPGSSSHIASGFSFEHGEHSSARQNGVLPSHVPSNVPSGSLHIGG